MTKHIQAYKEANPTRAREGAENKPRRINLERELKISLGE